MMSYQSRGATAAAASEEAMVAAYLDLYERIVA